MFIELRRIDHLVFTYNFDHLWTFSDSGGTTTLLFSWGPAIVLETYEEVKALI